MRWGIKYGGVIYVSESKAGLVNHMTIEVGPNIYFGEEVPEGWWREVEPVHEPTLALLANDYKIEEVAS